MTEEKYTPEEQKRRKQVKIWMTKLVAMLFLGAVVGILFSYIISNCVDCPDGWQTVLFWVSVAGMLFFTGLAIGMESDDDE